ncbi:hypothetical protein ACFVT5_41215 [Streptomyces sp. NPDC058001]|uniref:hypothetical protein n=1 Tax=Streptomyces sp. NPDC058001 TaxID=3346300 RepID=UPI0036E0AB69
MQIIRVAEDGAVTIEIAAREVKDVYDDLNYLPFSHITPSGAKLWELLEKIVGRETL